MKKVLIIAIAAISLGLGAFGAKAYADKSAANSCCVEGSACCAQGNACCE